MRHFTRRSKHLRARMEKFPTFGHLLDTPVDVRVPAAAKFDPERRPFQAKHPAEIGLEITAVTLRDAPERSALHHHVRRVAAALRVLTEPWGRGPPARPVPLD